MDTCRILYTLFHSVWDSCLIHSHEEMEMQARRKEKQRKQRELREKKAENILEFQPKHKMSLGQIYIV